MSSALRKPMTLEEFLAWEERQELRWEFDGFAPVAMTGGTIGHARIQGNLIVALTLRLRGSRCEPLGPDVKIEVAGRMRYPDALVVCSPQPNTATIANNPVVVFEIVSPDSQHTDRFVKAREYGVTASIQRYIILEQTSQTATVFTHMNGVWASVIVDGDAALEMPEIGISVQLAELYLDVELPAEDDVQGR